MLPSGFDVLWLVIAAIYASALAVILWLGVDARPRGKKMDGASHVHQGAERSRHEVGGHTVIVGECGDCKCHFNLVLP